MFQGQMFIEADETKGAVNSFVFCYFNTIESNLNQMN